MTALERARQFRGLIRASSYIEFDSLCDPKIPVFTEDNVERANFVILVVRIRLALFTVGSIISASAQANLPRQTQRGKAKVPSWCASAFCVSP